MAAPVILTTPVDVSLGSFGAWTDIDVSAIDGYTSEVTGVLVEVIVASTTSRAFGLRKNGSTDNRTHAYPGVVNGRHQVVAIGVDANGVFEGYAEAGEIDFWVVGFLTEAVFFTNAVDKSTASTSTWVDVDVSGDTGGDTAVGVWLEMISGGRIVAVRKNGSTDSRVSQSTGTHSWLYCGVDTSEIFEQWINIDDADLYLVGYQKSGSVVYHTNAIDRSTATTGSYVSLPALPTYAIAGIFEWYLAFGSTTFQCNIRAAGASHDRYHTIIHDWFVCACNAAGVIEQKIADGANDLFEIGYFQLPSAAVVERRVARSTDDAHAGSITNDSGRVVASGGAILTSGVSGNDLTSALLSPGSHGANNEVSAGMRFTAMVIPKDVVISSAVLTVTAQATYAAGGTIRFHVSAQAADDPVGFAIDGDSGGGGSLRASGASAPNLNRARSTAGATVTLTSVVADQEYTVDVTAEVQEIVNRAGWLPGRAIAVLFDTHADTAESEWQDLHSFDGSPAKAPKLTVAYGLTPASAARQVDQRRHPRPVMRHVATHGRMTK